MSSTNQLIQLVHTNKLRHIEGHSLKRVEWLRNKIESDGFWTVPLKIDDKHQLVMDGQHRMEVALKLGLSCVPCIIYDYHDVKVWSLRDNYIVDVENIISRSLTGNIYPYKTAKHEFPYGSKERCRYKLEELV